MNNYEESAGRGMEIVVGLLVSFIALVFGLLFSMLVLNADLHLASLTGGLVLGFFTYWFTQIAFRLLLNKPRRNGGLFSVGGLRFWCVFLSLSSVCVAMLSVYIAQWDMFFSAIFMLGACSYGWKVANKRNQQN